MILLALILAAAEPSDYPPGLFEHSPLIERHGGHRPRHERHERREDGGGCHHYEDWRYPYPQPC